MTLAPAAPPRRSRLDQPDPDRQFYVTFGQQYRRDPHPTYTEAHPDRWVRVDLTHAELDQPARIHATELVVHRIGRAWSMLYDQSDFTPAYYPLGEVAVWRDNGDTDRIDGPCTVVQEQYERLTAYRGGSLWIHTDAAHCFHPPHNHETAAGPQHCVGWWKSPTR